MPDEMTLEGLAGEMRSLVGELRNEIGALRQEITGEIGGLRQEMQTEIGGLRQEMADAIKSEAADLRHDMDRGFNQTKALIEQVHDKVGITLEGQIALRESMERRFDDAKLAADERHDLLSKVAGNFGVRTGRLERKSRRRG